MHKFVKRIILTGNKIESLLRIQDAEELNKYINSFLKELEKLNKDIELPNLYNILARYYIFIKDNDNALKILSNAYKIENENSLLFGRIITLSLFGEISFIQKDYENSYNYFRKALEDAKQIAGSIDDNKDKRIFMETEMIKTLASMIKKLSGILSHKNGAGVAPALK